MVSNKTYDSYKSKDHNSLDWGTFVGIVQFLLTTSLRVDHQGSSYRIISTVPLDGVDMNQTYDSMQETVNVIARALAKQPIAKVA